MSYTKTNWVNDSAPAINAENLNKIETGIAEAHEMGGGGDGGFSLTSDESVNYGEIELTISDFTVEQNAVVMFRPKNKTTNGTHLSQISINGTWYDLKNFNNASIDAWFFNKVYSIADIYMAFYDSTENVFFVSTITQNHIDLKIETLNMSNVHTSDTGVPGDVWMDDDGTLKIVMSG